MLDSVHIQGFKGLDDVTVPLSKLTVIVGPNAVGKSSVLEAIDLALRVVEQGSRSTAASSSVWWDDVVDDSLSGRLVSRRGDRPFQIRVEKGQDSLSFGKAISDDGRAFSIVWRRPPGNIVSMNFPVPNRTAVQLWENVRASEFGTSVRLGLDARKIAAAHYSDDQKPLMARDGEGLSSCIAWLSSLRDARLESVERDLQSIVPKLRRIRAVRTQVVRPVGHVVETAVGERTVYGTDTEMLIGSRIEIEHAEHGWLSAESLSEGTLIALGLLYTLHVDPPRTVLLDDIDKGLHPSAQVELVRVLKAIQEKHDVQIIATSHSPFVVNELEGDEVVVMGFVEDGTRVVARRLSEHPDWERQRTFLDVGEFWSNVGESWVAPQ